MNKTLCRWAAGAAFALASTGSLAASPPEETAAAVAVPAERETAFAGSKVANDAALNGATAREDLSLIAQSQQANTVSRNSVNGVTTTGEISIADNAFQNASGLTVINANTGNNVAMNASLNVNIVMTGPQ
ncbi:MAG TPA: hypothetical protein VGB70_14700 [Allosphingosinicella sp.]|jgi:hypothetical protein